MEYVLKNQLDFDLVHIFECGQCFRWNKENDESFTGVIKDRVINIKKENNDIKIQSSSYENIENVIYDYFDLENDYSKIKSRLANIDEYLKISTEFGNGIRILHQDLWECIISFIISANNNIPRIKRIIERLSKEYGKKIIWNEKEYYTFPTPEELSKVTIQDYRNLGLGFRDKRVFKTVHMILEKQVDLDEIQKMNDSNKIREELLKLDGVGEKVADCIMLFSLKRYDVFPIDVWVRRVMNDLYIHNEDENNVNKKELKQLAEDKFFGISGLAQQYLFYWRREKGA